MFRTYIAAKVAAAITYLLGRVLSASACDAVQFVQPQCVYAAPIVYAQPFIQAFAVQSYAMPIVQQQVVVQRQVVQRVVQKQVVQQVRVKAQRQNIRSQRQTIRSRSVQRIRG